MDGGKPESRDADGPEKLEWHKELLIYVNGRRTVVKNAKPETTLLQYLRQTGLTGTKLGCGEVSLLLDLGGVLRKRLIH